MRDNGDLGRDPDRMLDGGLGGVLGGVLDKVRRRGPEQAKDVAWDAAWGAVWDGGRGPEAERAGDGDEVAVAAWVEQGVELDCKLQFSQSASWTAVAPLLPASRTCGVTF